MIRSILVGICIGFIWYYRRHPIPRFNKTKIRKPANVPEMHHAQELIRARKICEEQSYIAKSSAVEMQNNARVNIIVNRNYVMTFDDNLVSLGRPTQLPH